GAIHYSNGSYYEGEWKEGDCHGKGKLIYADGGIYEGSFKKGEPDGKGKIQYVGGDHYDGQWKAGKRKGKGTYTRSDGFYRVGTFDDDGTNYVKFYNNKGEEITYEQYYPEG
ncbi:MAG: molecular chaperone Tir, partial [Flavobacterium sp.]